ncbi:RecD-like DNA helicase [Lacticaseibacillus paracasei]|nr:RecD-like DNA helicase [Lacticaseibacillus paracasei]
MQSIDANPYLLMSVAQLDFKKVDTFAKTRGIAANDPHRLTAGLQYIFRTAVLTQGLTYITITWFRQQAATLLAVREADLKMFADPQEALQYGFLLNEQYGLVTSCDMFATEGSVARIIKVAQKTAEPLMAPGELDDALDQFLDRFHLTINDQQRAAFQNVNRHGLSVLNGSAGTGKTWLTDLLVRFLTPKQKGKVSCLHQLAAPPKFWQSIRTSRLLRFMLICICFQVKKPASLTRMPTGKPLAMRDSLWWMKAQC